MNLCSLWTKVIVKALEKSRVFRNSVAKSAKKSCCTFWETLGWHRVMYSIPYYPVLLWNCRHMTTEKVATAFFPKLPLTPKPRAILFFPCLTRKFASEYGSMYEVLSTFLSEDLSLFAHLASYEGPDSSWFFWLEKICASMQHFCNISRSNVHAPLTIMVYADSIPLNHGFHFLYFFFNESSCKSSTEGIIFNAESFPLKLGNAEQNYGHGRGSVPRRDM